MHGQAAGGVEIVVNSKVYRELNAIEDVALHELIQAAIDEWQTSGQVHTDTSDAIPTVPLKFRLYATPTETYKIDYVRFYACHVVYLPIILDQ